MFEQARTLEPRNAVGDWAVCGGIAFVFVSVVTGRFSTVRVELFPEIGLDQPFRVFAGVVEVLGGILVLIPATVTVGLALLGCTMASAALLLIFVVGRTADSVFSVVLCTALTFSWWQWRNR